MLSFSSWMPRSSHAWSIKIENGASLLSRSRRVRWERALEEDFDASAKLFVRATDSFRYHGFNTGSVRSEWRALEICV